MRWKAPVEEVSVLTPEGEYTGKPVNIYDKTGPNGVIVHIDFKLSTEDECDECVVSGIASKKLTENMKLGRWVAAILGCMPEVGEEVIADDLLRKECHVVIKHKTNAKGKVFANVVQVLPAS